MTFTAGLSPTGVIREILSNKSERALAALEGRTWHSWKMALDRSKALPETANLAGMPPLHLYVNAGAGARVTDTDGTSFIDLCVGHGAQILGHAHPTVQEAIVAQAARGWNLGLPEQNQLALAGLIQAAGPANERIVLCNAGSDAILLAARLARTFSHRHLIAVFDPADQSGYEREKKAPPIADGQMTLSYGAPVALTHIRAHRHDLAAVVVSAIDSHHPSVEHVSWLHALADLCRELGVLLVVDEQLTGFRLAYGGAQELFGLTPDLVVYGSAVGGGLPLGAVAGRADVIDLFFNRSAGHDGANSPMFTGNALSIAAGIATLRHLHEQRAVLYPALNDAGRILAEGFNAFAARERLPVVMRAVGSIFRIIFGVVPATGERLSSAPQSAAEAAFYIFTLNRGVLMHASRRGFLSTAHTAADIAQVQKVFGESLCDVQDDGLLPRLN